MSDELETPTAAAAATAGSGRSSLLAGLRARRDDIASKALLDLPVPRWSEPEIIVRYRPLNFEEIKRVQQRLEKSPRERRTQEEVGSNADVLIRACVAVIGRLDGQDYSLRLGDPKGEFTTFDPDLAQNLGLDDDATARAVVKELFITDGDIIQHARRLIEWSGYKNEEIEEALEGE